MNITSKNWAQETQTLVFSENKEPIPQGLVVSLADPSERVMVQGGEAPHKPSSTGRVNVKYMDEDGMQRSFFPGVIGAEWVTL